ncbi:LacI family transcriptional regulator [Pelomonas saccharophila]|uniref:LacI family transcriptional regulator n=1 Tax=Roseateles saccharophilus TaxID=304 RepID=A0ABU1YGE4_ROSSA|nr:LacI family DNA-binding transcriptional regulator [Roseateles saccharophilus]MDR7267927.1 LacI family transcriptional regulator [Roseateles saccharophilus]
MKHAERPDAVPKPATVMDVARLAGVSMMTVSRVVNGEATVRPTTRIKVQAAVAALNYTPNPSARKLAGSRPILLGLLYSDARAGYLSGFMLGLLSKLSLRHVQLNAQYCDANSDGAQAVAAMLANGINGLILPPPFCDSQPLLDLIARSGTPAVTVSAGQPVPNCYGVSIDDYKAAYEMTRHLLALGHQRLGFIRGDPGQSSSERRLAGFRAAVAEAGLDTAHDIQMVQGRFTYHSGLDAAEQLLSSNQRPSAIFASNDDMAAATVAVAHRLGLYVPSDLTVAGFDDAPLATTIWPELTTVRQPIGEMASAAVDMLVRHIRAWRNGVKLPFGQQMMEHALIRRQSDAAPRHRPAVRLGIVA